MQTPLHFLYRRFYDTRYDRLGFNRPRLYDINTLVFEADPCYYCGEPGVTEDHTFPLVALDGYLATGELPPRHMLKIVPACAECNSMLGALVFQRLDQRKRYVKKAIRKKYRKVLDIPEWEDYELTKMSLRMQEYIAIGLSQKERILKRLAW